ncbi:probable pectinesterase/pectinesterase inhibitor 36 [Vigna umbellata]|uniref:probable pectinesterase/pectinesterase inhibitor 36 n=1 Tax=Vigna umbellata TaxID=87088 RepID=UPI001F5F9739|nr:probable pectinesterase/pectinesterase inhibitor 36 [Vigna umbellata]
MATYATTATATATTLFLILGMATTTLCLQEKGVLQMAQNHVSQAKNWVANALTLHGFESLSLSFSDHQTSVIALRDCSKLYEESESRLSHMMSQNNTYTREDALTWISAVMTNHRTCLDGLQEKGYLEAQILDRNLTMSLKQALILYSRNKVIAKGPPLQGTISKGSGILESWSEASYKPDFTVAQDGSGTHRTIQEAVNALSAMGNNRPARAIIYVKSGVYNEKVNIGQKLHNVMFVGDGIDRTVVTGNRNVVQGSTTLSSATFDVSGDGFWARDMTFENSAGPEKHQAVALKVSSDLSVFYRCSFKGYQDTLYVLSNRQFYRDCEIYGTVDFIFGDAAVVLQNCDILVRKPLSQQSNFITAQGRDDPNKNTGIAMQSCRVRAASDFASLKNSQKTFLGRPWRKYSRTVFMKSELDEMIEPKGWGEWSGSFALSTLFYGEYMNTGGGASTANRVRWPGFHVLSSATEASPFTVRQFVQGERWIPATGVPYSSGI